MTVPECDSLDELIADCAHLPDSLRAETSATPIHAQVPVWRINDWHLAQVGGLEPYFWIDKEQW
ncbi:MAG: hypothetical protein ACRDQ5_27490 [Sciscionella sp.]